MIENQLVTNKNQMLKETSDLLKEARKIKSKSCMTPCSLRKGTAAGLIWKMKLVSREETSKLIERKEKAKN